MSVSLGITLRRVWLPAILVVFAACDSGAKKQLQEQLAQLTSISAEKDSLLQQVAENARLMSDISVELAKVKSRKGGMVVNPESPLQMSRDSILEAIKDVTARVNDSEEKLQASQRRIRSMTRQSDSLRTQITAFETAIADFQKVIDNQKATIQSLSDQVNTLMAENVRLAAVNTALKDTMATLEEKDNTVYYVIGTKKDLMERGIVTEQGGSRVLFIFGKRGKTLVPAVSLDTNQFTAINKEDVTEIALPRADKKYRIASRQNLTHLAEPPTKDGKVQGSLHIVSPEEFWLPSKFLILVES